jgi:hypothetical protein
MTLVERVRKSFPAQLLKLPIWLLWEYRPNPKGGKPRKVPLYANGDERSGTLDSEADRSRLVTFAAAAKALGRKQGLGIALGVAPDGLHLSGIDADGIDDPLNDDRIKRLLKRAGSYAELSPSGKGIHILGLGDIGKQGANGSGLEIYSGLRYFTVTGDCIQDEDLSNLKAAAALARKLFPKPTKEKAESTSTVAEGSRNNTLYRLGRQLLGSVDPSQDEMTAILKIANEQRCDPPLDDDEVETIARSVMNAAEEWPDPESFLRDFDARALDPALIPGVVGEYAKAWSDESGIDISAVVMPCLTATASAIDDGFKILANEKTNWRESARLWSLVVAMPGSGKTPAQSNALSPLWEIHRQLATLYEFDEENSMPAPRLIVSDTTVEALATALIANPRGLLVATDEFESWLGSQDRYRGGNGAASRDRGEWLRLFDGGPHAVERIERGTIFVPNFGVSVMTATTPAALAKMSKALPEDGLLQRFLVVSAKPRSSGEGNAPADLSALRKRYTELLSGLYDTKADGACDITLTDDAAGFLSEFNETVKQQVQAVYPVNPALAGHLAKQAAFLLRLTLVFHAIKSGRRRLAKNPVDLTTLEEAAKLLKLFNRHSVAIYTKLGGDSGPYGLARRVARFLLAKNSAEVERRQLLSSLREFNSADEREQAAALGLLEDFGWIRPEEGKYRKGHATRFAVNPRLAKKFAALAEQERRQREERRQLLTDRIGKGD